MEPIAPGMLRTIYPANDSCRGRQPFNPDYS
jgi:hypothetical protein